MNLTGRKYNAIIGQNFLVPFRTKIDLGSKYKDILGNKIHFENNDHYYILN